VNPHGQEFPDGASNLAYGLFGFRRSEKRRRIDGRFVYYRELYDQNYPQQPKSSVSAAYSLKRGFEKKKVVELEQKLELIDNYYTEMGKVSWKLSTEVSTKLPLSRVDSLQLSVENRAGGPAGGRASGGVGVSAEIVRRMPRRSASFRLMGYVTDDDEFAALYPYERPLYSWSSFGPALRGSGVYGYVLSMRELGKNIAVGAKARWNLDVQEPGENIAGASILSEFRF
jgi:hypothetical protein